MSVPGQVAQLSGVDAHKGDALGCQGVALVHGLGRRGHRKPQGQRGCARHPPQNRAVRLLHGKAQRYAPRSQFTRFKLNALLAVGKKNVFRQTKIREFRLSRHGRQLGSQAFDDIVAQIVFPEDQTTALDHEGRGQNAAPGHILPQGLP